MVTYGDVIAGLWEGRCNVYEKRTVTNAASGRSEQQEIATAQDVPCRLSYGASPAAGEGSAPAIAQAVRLFLGAEVVINPGSKVVVTQNGRTEPYKRSGIPAVYKYHQEIQIEPWERWA